MSKSRVPYADENPESRVAIELRKRYDAMKRQHEQTGKEKDKIHSQFQSLLKIFAT